MLRTKQPHTYTYYQFNQHLYTLNTSARQPHLRYQYINSNYTSPFFLKFIYCIKDITTSQEPRTTPSNTQTKNPQSSTRISFQDNPYTFEERHARLTELLKPVFCQALLSEPQYKPVYKIYPPLQQDLNRARH